MDTLRPRTTMNQDRSLPPGMRIGFQYWLHDTQKGQETYTVPLDLQAMQDPSLWGLLGLAK